MKDLSVFVVVRYNSFLQGAIPLKGFIKRLGGVLKATAFEGDEWVHLVHFDRKIYGDTFCRVIGNLDLPVETTVLRENQENSAPAGSCLILVRNHRFECSGHALQPESFESPRLNHTNLEVTGSGSMVGRVVAHKLFGS